MGRKSSPDLLSRYLNVLMGLAYLGGGIYLVASSQSLGILPTGVFRYTLAVLMIIYGLFRIYRVIERSRE